MLTKFLLISCRSPDHYSADRLDVGFGQDRAQYIEVNLDRISHHQHLRHKQGARAELLTDVIKRRDQPFIKNFL